MLQEHRYQVCPEIALRGDEAERYAQKFQPDLVLLDICIDGPMDGIEVGRRLCASGFPFIYLTAFSDQCTLDRARETLPEAYLVKPFGSNDLHAAIEVALHKLSTGEKDVLAKDENETKSNVFFVRDKDRFVKIHVHDIRWVEGLDHYIVLQLRNGKQILHSTLKKMEERLYEFGFVRIHKSYIVNMEEVSSVCNYKVELGKVELPVGRSYRDSLMKRLELI